VDYKKYSSQAIVLARKNFGEADRVLTVYSKKYGKIKLLAKGVRKPKSRKRGHIEVFNNIYFSASSTKGMPIILEAENLESFERIRKDLKKVAVAYYFMEVVKNLAPSEEKNERLYDLVLDYLERLANLDYGFKRLRYSFVREILIVLGFWPPDRRMDSPDEVLEEILEKKMGSLRVGRRLVR